jgi:curved DNA-binding protein CbpA
LYVFFFFVEICTHKHTHAQVHPDKNPEADGDSAAEAFKKLSQAYECLVDPSEQKRYFNISKSSGGAGGTKRQHSATNAEAETPGRRSTGQPWWEGGWEAVDAYMSMQEERFQRDNERHEKEREAFRAAKMKKSSAANKRVNQTMSAQKRRLGLGGGHAADEEDEGDEDQWANYKSKPNTYFRVATETVYTQQFEKAAPAPIGLDDNGNPISEHETSSEDEAP